MRSIAVEVLQRRVVSGQASELGDFFRVKRDRRRARCALFTHALGWELKLYVGARLLQARICLTQEDVFSTGERWKDGLLNDRWVVNHAGS